MKYLSFPKVNLFLLVSKKNPKKELHKIKSFFLLISNSLFDEVEINFNNKNKKDEIVYFNRLNKRFEIKDCIFKKALSLLRQNKILDNNLYLKITVKKKIPLFSGVGSGASNVACLFKFLLYQKIIKLNKKIKKLILKTGSDVMFFIKNYECAKVYGYGEKVKKIKIRKKIKIKLFFNNMNCSSKEIFNCFDRQQKNKKKSYLKQFLYFKINRYSLLINDLEKCVFGSFKELYWESKKIESQYNKKVFVSGSGGTLFLIE